MQGRHEYQPELFSQIDIEGLIPKNHLLRKIDRVLDLSFLREETAQFYSADKGRPSIDPEIFVRMVLLEFLYNIDSDRQLCEEIGFNLAYRWFCRFSMKDSVPDHSSMTKVRDRLGEETYKQIFLKVVEQCRKSGLVKGERLMVDGSMIYANASLYNMEEREGKADKNDVPTHGESGYSGSKDKLSSNDLRSNSLVGKKISNETHVSKSDPDCSLAGKHGEYKSLRYKTHHTADFDSRVILDCHVTTGMVSEVTKFIERIEHVEKELKLKIGEVIADRGYGSAHNLQYLERKKIESNIPLWSTRSGSTFVEDLNYGFKFDPEKMSIHCPEGHKMWISFREAERTAYTLSKSVCHACPRRFECLTENELKTRGKRFFLPDAYKIFLETLKKQEKLEFKLKLRARMWKLEGLFGEAKANHGLRRARYRGRAKVQMQVYMISAVQNLKRLANAVYNDIISIILIWAQTCLMKNLSRKTSPKSAIRA